MNYWYTQQYGWISKKSCQVKEDIPKQKNKQYFKYCMFPFIWHSSKGKKLVTADQSFPGVWGGAKGWERMTAKSPKGIFGNDRNV